RPEIEEAGGCVTVRFRPSRYVPPARVQTNLTVHQRELLAALDSGGNMALRELKAALGARSIWAIKDDLVVLRNLGLVGSQGHGRGAYWFRLEG
ncbi:MAG TPA: hypothetical protein VH120_08335, partial [Gemmataceae bacterium]|nr:hypothetical protein [Gemmataceae bacterium]